MGYSEYRGLGALLRKVAAETANHADARATDADRATRTQGRYPIRNGTLLPSLDQPNP
jgi:hypothetical protein